MNSLEQLVIASKIPLLPAPTRIHPLESFSTPHSHVFIKRDDEHGGIINGSKKRKYLSLFHQLDNYDEWIILGSSFSNHVVAMTQAAKEKKIRPFLVLEGSKPLRKKGNYLLTSLLMDEKDIFYVSKSGSIRDTAMELALERKAMRKKVKVIPVGGDCKESVLGALTLPLEICKQEKTEGVAFDHIFVDSGTGFMAASLILGLSILKHKSHVHTILMADEESDFQRKINHVRKWLKEDFQIETDNICSHSCYKPYSAKSFGAVNKTILSSIKEMAHQEGIFLDPLYNAKLFLTAKKVIEEQNLKGKVLIVHSGGTASLLGFDELF